MRKLAVKTKGLILLTATPMQIHPVEIWDLLNLLGLPKDWTAAKFLEFFRITRHVEPDAAILATAAALFREVEAHFQQLDLESALNWLAM